MTARGPGTQNGQYSLIFAERRLVDRVFGDWQLVNGSVGEHVKHCAKYFLEKGNTSRTGHGALFVGGGLRSDRILETRIPGDKKGERTISGYSLIKTICYVSHGHLPLDVHRFGVHKSPYGQFFVWRKRRSKRDGPDTRHNDISLGDVPDYRRWHLPELGLFKSSSFPQSFGLKMRERHVSVLCSNCLDG